MKKIRFCRVLGGAVLLGCLIGLVLLLTRQSYLLGQGPTLSGGLLGRKIDNTIKSLLFTWRDGQYRQDFYKAFGYALPAAPLEVQTGVPVLLHSYLVESLQRAKARHALHQTLSTHCPQCCIVPLVGPWYQQSQSKTSISHATSDWTMIPFQESEMEEWMYRQFGEKNNHDASSLWDFYKSLRSAKDRVQLAALLLVLTHGGVFTGPNYDKSSNEDAFHHETSSSTLILDQDSLDVIFLQVTSPLTCAIEHLTTTIASSVDDWPGLIKGLQELSTIGCNASANPLSWQLVQRRETTNDLARNNDVVKVIDISPAVSRESANVKQPKQDELVRRNCRAGWFCHRCLRLPWRGSLQACQWLCSSCYTDVITSFDPEYEETVFEVRQLSAATDPTASGKRRIPRIIHQTWFEPVDAPRYPHLNRLQNSWKALQGWEYRFYTDDTAREYILAHFPIRFAQAYDAILPGAFKADFFRLVVLLREGGVYADIDVQLDTDLDSFLDANISFFVPRDCPLDRWPNSNYCLWNGFMGSVPGHPILVQAVEDLMNNVLNRFDYYDVEGSLVRRDMSTEIWKLRSIPILLLTGPCALGISVNKAAQISNLLRGFQLGWLPEMEGVLFLHTDRYDIGELRFTDLDRNILVASTNADALARKPLPTENKSSSVSKKESVHYSKSESEIVGSHGIYKDNTVANERIVLRFQGEGSVSANA